MRFETLFARQDQKLRIYVIRVICVILISPCNPVAAQGLPDEISTLLDRYARGDQNLLAAYATPSELERLRHRLSREADAWIRRGNNAQAVRRRQLVAATMALDAARLSLDADWAQGRALIEWASTLLRKAPPDEGERSWHLAAVALIQGAYDNELLVQQQKQAWPRFEHEPRLLLALVVMLEGDTWPDPDRGEPWNSDDASLEDASQLVAARRKAGQVSAPDLRQRAYEYQRRTRMRTAITLLEDLSNAESIRADVVLRLGYLHLRLQRSEIALEQFEEVLTLTKEPFLLYLAHMLAGIAHEQEGDHGNAIAAYRAALDVVPRAQSASVALASLLFIGNARAEAARIIDSAVAMPVAGDPWRMYPSGDFRLWPERISALRKAIQ